MLGVAINVTTDFLCQLKRHSIEGYGQGSHGSSLFQTVVFVWWEKRLPPQNLLGPLGSRVRTEIDAAVQAARDRWPATHNGETWRGDDLNREGLFFHGQKMRLLRFCEGLEAHSLDATLVTKTTLYPPLYGQHEHVCFHAY